MNYEHRIKKLIEADELRMRALHAVKALELPDWLIAAGFVRNLVWSSLYANTSKIVDIDVIYFCSSDKSKARDCALEQRLRTLEPELPWSVKNQARMHLKNGDLPYKDTMDAMKYWPEKQTAVGVNIDDNGNTQLRLGFEIETLFNGQINHNPARSSEIFRQRVRSKGWLRLWPELNADR